MRELRRRYFDTFNIKEMREGEDVLTDLTLKK